MTQMTQTASDLPRVLVFGEALTDFVRDSSALMDDAGGAAWRSVAGGACWNVARVAATLGVASGFGGAVSSDLFGQEIVALSRAAHLDMRFLQVVERPPLIAMVHQAHPPQYFFLGAGTADLAFDSALLPAGWQGACEIAHFGCISLVRQPLGARLFDLAVQLKAQGVRISFDPNYRNLMDAEYPRLFEAMMALSDIVKISDEDLLQIYPGRSAEASLQAVRRMAPQALLLYTRGAAGMTLYTAHGEHVQPSFAVPVADTVGAGDASIGGFLASLLAAPQASYATHVRFAAASAAAACTRRGAHAPTPAEVAALLARAPQ
jgi:fructokinase